MTSLVKAIEGFLRRVIALPLLRLVFRNPIVETPVDLSCIKRVLILRHDRIGDMIITIPILKALRRRNPTVKLCVLASRANADLVRDLRVIDELYVLEENWIKLVSQIVQLRRRRFDVVLNLVFNRTTGPGVFSNLIAPNGHKVGQGPERYAFYFNRMAKLRRFEQHMAESYVAMIEQVFGIVLDDGEKDLEMGIRPEHQSSVDAWLRGASLHRKSRPELGFLPYVVVNPTGKDIERRLSVAQVAALVNHLSLKPGFRTVVLDPPGYSELVSAMRTMGEFARCLVFRTGMDGQLDEIASLIEGALAVITPDTSLVHFASAVRTPVFGIYTDLKGSKEWLPYRIEYDLVTSERDQPISMINSRLLNEKAERFVNAMIRRQESTTLTTR